MTQKSPFHEIHMQSSAVMQSEHGWMMPRHYGDVEQELKACREAVAVIDESNMYRIRISGKDAGELLGHFLGDGTDINGLLPGRQCYCKLPVSESASRDAQNSAGGGTGATTGIAAGMGTAASTSTVAGICRVLHLQKGYMLIGEPGDYDYVLRELESIGKSMQVKVQDQTSKTAMVFITGPGALPLLKEKLPIDTSLLQEDGIVEQTLFMFVHFIIVQMVRPADGANIILPAVMADKGWALLEKYGKEYGIQLAGHDVRDMLYA